MFYHHICFNFNFCHTMSTTKTDENVSLVTHAIRFGTSGVCHNSATITRLCYLTNPHCKGLTMNSEESSFMPKNSEKNSVRWHSNPTCYQEEFFIKKVCSLLFKG